MPHTRDTVATIRGYKNGLLVRAVSSIDQAYYVKNRGIVLYGQVMPGSPLAEMGEPNVGGDDPRVADFAAVVSVKDLRHDFPRLRYDDFFAVPESHWSCTAGLSPVALNVDPDPNPVVKLIPSEGSPWHWRLGEQKILIAKIDKVTRGPVTVALGPRHRDPLYFAVLPISFVRDVGTLLWDGVSWPFEFFFGWGSDSWAQATRGSDPCAPVVAALPPAPSDVSSAPSPP